MRKPSASAERQLVATKPAANWPAARAYVLDQIHEHPIRTTLVSLGAGYLLGGGLFSALTARVVGSSLRLALRAATLPVVVQSGVEIGRQFFTDSPPTSAE